MHMIELAGVIFTLSIEVQIGIIFTQSLKATGRDKTAQLSSHGFVIVKKLYYLIKSIYFGVLTSIKRQNNTNAKVEGQRTAERAESQRLESQSSPKSKSGDLRPQGLDLKKRINR